MRVAEVRVQQRSPRLVQSDVNASTVGIAVRHGDRIHGSQHPELLMPYEIFTAFMRAAYAHDDDTAAEFRAQAEQKIAELALPADFLSVLQSESAAFILLQTREESLRAEVAQSQGSVSATFAEIRDLQRQQCPLRADTIRRLRQHYGIAFDRFLYEVIAPNVVQEFTVAPEAETLRAEEAGCQ